ncbi:MAG: 3'-5' exonuclease, partial [Bacillota bacterium]
KILYATLVCSHGQSSTDEFVYLQELELSINSIEIEDEVKVNAIIIQLIKYIEKIGEKLQTAIGGDMAKTRETFEEIIHAIIEHYGIKILHDFFPQYQNGDYFDRVKSKFVDLLWEEFSHTRDWLKSLKAFEGETSVPAMTIHKSKGLEFECVFLVGLEDNSFFSFERQRDEDICAFFVAISRAKNELHITRSNSRQ